MASTNPVSLKSLNHADFLFMSLKRQFKRGFPTPGLFLNGQLCGERVDGAPKHQELTCYMGQATLNIVGVRFCLLVAIIPSKHDWEARLKNSTVEGGRSKWQGRRVLGH